MEMKSRRECPASQRGKRPLREAERRKERERGKREVQGDERTSARDVDGDGREGALRVPGATVALKACQIVSCSHRAQLLCRHHVGGGEVNDEEKDGSGSHAHLSVLLGANGGQCRVMIIPEDVRTSTASARCQSLSETMTLRLCAHVAILTVKLEMVVLQPRLEET